MYKYEFHYDAGHGWLKVPTSEIDAFGLDISNCSYMSDNCKTTYLEEDCDYPQFIEAAGLDLMNDIVEINDGPNSPIRQLERYVKA